MRCLLCFPTEPLLLTISHLVPLMATFLNKFFWKQNFQQKKRLKTRGWNVRVTIVKNILVLWHPRHSQREAKTRRFCTLSSIDKVATDIFACNKHLSSGLTPRVSVLTTRPRFCLMYDGEAKNYKAKISEANLHVRKMTVTENVYTAIETTLTKLPAIYRCTEITPTAFLLITGSSSWNHGDIFNREPIFRYALAMNSNQAFLGSKRSNPYYFQEFNLSSVPSPFTGLVTRLLAPHWLPTIRRKI